MKTLIWTLVFTFASLISLQSQAWISHDEPTKQYAFKFKMKEEVYEYAQMAPSYEEAYEKAAKACYSHFKGGRHLTEDMGLDIIDVCANPRSI